MNLVSFRDFLKLLRCLLPELNELPYRMKCLISQQNILLLHLPLEHFVVSSALSHPIASPFFLTSQISMSFLHLIGNGYTTPLSDPYLLRSLSYISCLLVLFHSLLCLTRTLYVTIGLEFSNGAYWANQWLQIEDNDSFSPRKRRKGGTLLSPSFIHN